MHFTYQRWLIILPCRKCLSGTQNVIDRCVSFFFEIVPLFTNRDKGLNWENNIACGTVHVISVCSFLYHGFARVLSFKPGTAVLSVTSDSCKTTVLAPSTIGLTVGALPQQQRSDAEAFCGQRSTVHAKHKFVAVQKSSRVFSFKAAQLNSQMWYCVILNNGTDAQLRMQLFYIVPR